MRKPITYLIVLTTFLLASMSCKTSKSAEIIQMTTFTNPIIWADVPDMSATRAGKDIYMISTTMNFMPGGPIMKSRDMVHWEIVNNLFDKITDTPKYDLEDGTVYGRGQWASSIRYHKGTFYALFSPNDTPYKSYIYKTTNPERGWELVTRTSHFHDASLFFDDDGRVYVFSGTASLRELKSDLSDVKPGGVDMQVFERDAEENGLLEGSQVIKHDGKYYLMMISWPQDKPRRQLCYRADKITGPYEKKVVLEDNYKGFPYAGQGCLIDDINGNWYALIFQDRGGVGRVPLLLPCEWVDGWPVLGDNGKVPAMGEVKLPTYDTGRRIVESDDFNDSKLKINWQWNHNPVDDAWSLTDRRGFLRLKTSKVVDNIFAAPNTLTQRMEGPKCCGVVAFDLTNMKDGDVAGVSAFNGHAGLLSIEMDGGRKYLTMSTNVVEFDESTPEIAAQKRIKNVDKEVLAKIELASNMIYLRIDADFNLNRDKATFYYSLDNEKWQSFGNEFQMRFDYQKLFIGTKFAIFNYATKQSGGYVDVDFFEYKKID